MIESMFIIPKVMISVLSLVLHLAAIHALKVHNKTSAKIYQKVQLGEKKAVLGHQLRKADDVLLIHKGSKHGYSYYPLCSVRQRDVATQTQEFSILDEAHLDESHFNFDEPLNVDQFLFMTPVKDRLLAITSSNLLYLFKFHNTSQQELNFDTLRNKTAGFKPLAGSSLTSNDIVQLVYCEMLNLGLLVYSDKAVIFSIDQFEEESEQLRVSSKNDWVSRPIRGKNVVFRRFLFSAVGSNGLDIYLLYEDMQVKFLRNVQSEDLQMERENKVYIVDFCVVEVDEGSVLVYLMDWSQGIMALKVGYSGESVESVVLVGQVGETQNGVIVEGWGESVFGVYKNHRHYTIQEYHFDFKHGNSWQVLATYTSRTKILNVKMTRDVAVLQGINYHRVLFYGVRHDFKYYSANRRMDFFHGGLRDIGFLRDDYMVGITKSRLFLMKHSVMPAHLVCFTDDGKYSNYEFEYSVLFNTSDCVEAAMSFDRTAICQKSIDLQVSVVRHYLFNDKKPIIIAVLVVAALCQLLLCVFICRMFLDYKVQSVQISKEIQEIKKKGHDHSTMIEMNQSLGKKQLNEQQ